MATAALQSQAMETLTIHVPKVDMKRLKGIVKAMGWTFEKGPKTLGDLTDEECWKHLCSSRPEGLEELSKEENEDFLNWLKAQ